jgi:S-adenosylmethionine-diacylglycerol 3-amino-3-carboxypropyl transferase
MNYLTENPKEIHAIDLNPAHVALGRLKKAAIKHLPDYESFFLFFGCADDSQNVRNYDRYIAPYLDSFTKNHWDRIVFPHGRRINMFKKNLYKYGLLGKFIGMIHILSKLYGQNPKDLLAAKTMEEQRKVFERTLGPLFEKKFIKMLCGKPESLYGLGIPPSQFDDLHEAASGDMASLLKSRLERMACDFPIESNYFAWQAFGRGYDRENKKAIPRYLMEEHYQTLKDNIDKVQIHHSSITDFLGAQEPGSFDGYVFLDAQDWMNEDQLNDLWEHVTRTASPNANVIFRTAGDDSPLTSALKSDILGQWKYDPAQAPLENAKDRSSIYGGFHTYRFDQKQGKKAAA